MSYSENANNPEFIKNQVESVSKAMRVYINRIIGLTALSDSPEEISPEEINTELKKAGYRLLAQNINLMYLYSDDLTSNRGIVIKADEYLGGIIGECTGMLDAVGGKLQYELKCERTDVRIDEKAFTLAVMNLLQNAFLYSPHKTTVIVTVDNEAGESGNYVSITVKNLMGMDKAAYRRDKEVSSGLGLSLSAKVAERYGGSLEYTESGGTTMAKMLLPLESEEQGLGLSSNYADYISDKYNPVKLFMREVTERKVPVH